MDSERQHRNPQPYYTFKSKPAVTRYGVVRSMSVNQRMTRSKPSSRLEEEGVAKVSFSKRRRPGHDARKAG